MQIINDFKDYYQHFDQSSIQGLGDFYASNVVFTDPVHQLTGLKSLERYFEQMCSDLTSCRFEFISEAVDQDDVWLKWNMHYQHPKINNNALLMLVGASHIQWADTSSGRKIIAHEDFYDLGSMLYEHLPVLGYGVRLIKKKLAKD